ncbi:MAG: hypothetical protein GF331_00815 [Chitinivibrionales bacterium]|nr:hypothetical protein [Chitinivibrionales bacterium]
MKCIGIAVPIALMALWAHVGAQQVSLNGTVYDVDGAPISGALVRMLRGDLHDITDAAGRYEINATIPVILTPAAPSVSRYEIGNGRVSFSLRSPTHVKVEIFDMRGARLGVLLDRKLPAGQHAALLEAAKGQGMLLVRTAFDGRRYASRYLPLAQGRAAAAPAPRTVDNTAALGKSAGGPLDTLRASAPGYLSSSEMIGAYTGTVNFVLQKPDSSTGSTAGQEDGSLDRLAAYGMEQYFYGDFGNGTEPMVQVLSAVGDNAVDAMLTFNPDFTDNSYGENAIGWSHHSFRHVYGSDHIELMMLNGVGDTVLHVKIDLLSSCPDAQSGWCSLGLEGDGELIKGDASAILSFGTSMDDNLNYYGCDTFTTSSPPTDSVYTPSPQCPNWEYYASYRITVDPAIFGPSGYGGVFMTSVHASPSKTGIETVPVTEGPPLNPDSPDNPWQYFDPYINPDPVVPDTTDTIPVTD